MNAVTRHPALARARGADLGPNHPERVLLPGKDAPRLRLGVEEHGTLGVLNEPAIQVTKRLNLPGDEGVVGAG
eukprot:4392006-Lingulodinium_polyedra.AAC.1